MKKFNNYYYRIYSCKTMTKEQVNKKSILFLLLLGAIIGFINGFWGGGGGMLCVPALSYLVGVEERKAHATTILIMLPLSIASFIIYLTRGFFTWEYIWSTGAGFVVGGLIGAYILKGINNNVLKLIFSFVILAGGIWLII